MKNERLVAATTFFVSGRKFIQRGCQWIDAAVLQMPLAPRIRVRFDSRHFFELLQRFPKTLPLLTAARNIRLVLAGTVYVIYE